MTTLSDKLTRGTVPLSNLPERTKIVDNSVMGLTIDGAGLGTFRPSTSGYCTKDADGKYWIHVEYAYTGTGNTTGHDLYFNTFSKADASEGGGAWAYVDALSAAAVSTRTNIGDRIQITYATNQDRGIGGFSFQVTKPTWFDTNREAGFSINAQVEEGTPTTAGILKSNLTKTKASTGGDHTSSGTISGLTFNNLKIGTTYSFSFKPFVVDTAVNNDVLSADVKNGATIVGSWQYRSDVESNGRYQWTLTGEFTATATTVTVDYNASATHYFAAGSTLLTLTELNNTADAGTAWD
jgi:hypothetical protein